jgi:hypothetical protein
VILSILVSTSATMILDVGVRLGARSRQVRSYNYFVKKAKCKYKYDITLVCLARDPVE